jgi:hypothetical protein
LKINVANMMKQFRFMAFVAIVLAAASFTTYAATTFVDTQGNYGNERCLVGAGGICSGGAYNNSLSMVSIFQNDLGAGNTLVRFDDSFDKLWMNTVTDGGQVQALARYAGDNSTFGYDAGAGFQLLSGILVSSKVRVNNASAYLGDTHTGDFVVAADSWTTIPVVAGTPFAFMLNDPVSGLLSSNNGVGAFDNMVTFQVYLNGVGQQHYFLAWEDRGISSDKDYNDYIVEVQFTNPVPEPEIYAMLGIGLGLMGWVGRRKKLQAA